MSRNITEKILEKVRPFIEQKIRKYLSRAKHIGYEYDDLLSEGIETVIVASKDWQLQKNGAEQASLESYIYLKVESHFESLVGKRRRQVATVSLESCPEPEGDMNYNRAAEFPTKNLSRDAVINEFLVYESTQNVENAMSDQCLETLKSMFIESDTTHTYLDAVTKTAPTIKQLASALNVTPGRISQYETHLKKLFAKK